MTTNDQGADGLHPTVRKIVMAWPIILAIGLVAADGLRVEWRIEDHEQRIEKLEAQMLPFSDKLTRIEQQNDDIVARLDRIERRQDQGAPK